MRKAGKIILTLLLIILVLLIGAYLFIGALWTGVFNFMDPQEIATYDSPDGNYKLVIEQLGAPDWPFGPVDVRLTLKNQDGKRINRVTTTVYNDGVSIDEDNIDSISWNEDEVTVVFGGELWSTVSVPYHKR